MRHLNLGSNFLATLPNVPPDLLTLKVHKNRIRELPPLPRGLTNLNLYLNPVPIPDLDFPRLEAFSYGGCTHLKELPPLALAHNLRWLILVANNIEFLPKDFTGLGSLEGVWLAKNNLKRLPEDIGSMKMRDITLYQNDLSRLPDSFFSLKLRKLNLSRNPLRRADRKKATEVFAGIEFFEMIP